MLQRPGFKPKVRWGDWIGESVVQILGEHIILTNFCLCCMRKETVSEGAQGGATARVQATISSPSVVNSLALGVQLAWQLILKTNPLIMAKFLAQCSDGAEACLYWFFPLACPHRKRQICRVEAFLVISRSAWWLTPDSQRLDQLRVQFFLCGS